MNEKKKHIHFVGIGGIGMSALAQLYKSKGFEVQGSDGAVSPVTKLLKEKDVKVFIGHDKNNVSKNTDFVVYSDAVPKDNPERLVAKEYGIKEFSYFEALGRATKNGTSIVISGTHGKTSTTAMVAKILIDAGKRPTVIAGSILSECGSNFIEGSPDLFVIEGCEYKRHFLHLHPSVLAITNIELDHTDYYKDFEDMKNAFGELLAKMPTDGIVVANTDFADVKDVVDECGLSVVRWQDTNVPELKVIGKFNVENAKVAKTVALTLFDDLKESEVDKSLSEFAGTWRRFEYKGITKNGMLVYDDYAHHPTAVEGTIKIAKKHFSDKKIIVLFHPHLYSRTKSFFDEFAKALSFADKVFLLPIYAAREVDTGITSSEKLAERVNEHNGNAVYVQTFEEAKDVLKKYDEKYLLLTMGAGDVYKIADEITER